MHVDQSSLVLSLCIKSGITQNVQVIPQGTKYLDQVLESSFDNLLQVAKAVFVCQFIMKSVEECKSLYIVLFVSLFDRFFMEYN